MCPHCKFLNEIFDQIESNREYWLYTEMFTYLHNGSDHCDEKNKPEYRELTDDEISQLG